MKLRFKIVICPEIEVGRAKGYVTVTLGRLGVAKILRNSRGNNVVSAVLFLRMMAE